MRQPDAWSAWTALFVFGFLKPWQYARTAAAKRKAGAWRVVGVASKANLPPMVHNRSPW